MISSITICNKNIELLRYVIIADWSEMRMYVTEEKKQFSYTPLLTEIVLSGDIEISTP